MVSSRHPLTSNHLTKILDQAGATDSQKKAIRKAFRDGPMVKNRETFANVIKRSGVTQRSSTISRRLKNSFNTVTGTRKAMTPVATPYYLARSGVRSHPLNLTPSITPIRRRQPTYTGPTTPSIRPMTAARTTPFNSFRNPWNKRTTHARLLNRLKRHR